MESHNAKFSAEEIAFQQALANTSFAALSIFASLNAIDSLIEQFVAIKEKYIKDDDKRYALMVQLQLLFANHSLLLERCFSDDDALARYFFMHERLSSLYEQISEYKPEEEEDRNDIEVPVSEEKSTEESKYSDDVFECPICYAEVSYSDTEKLKTCKHRYCKECLNLYYCNIINGGGNVCGIVCPNPTCAEPVQDSDIRKAVDASTMQKYERFSLLTYLNSNPNAHWCPHPGCDNVMIADPGQERIRCEKCYRSSCVQCKTIWHPDMTCGENTVSQSPEDEKTKKWKRKHGVKACPYCGLETIRVSGCPDMLCSSCNVHWNWHAVGEKTKETWIERAGYLYPRTMKRVIGSRDVLEDWQKDKKGTALYLTPFMVASTVLGIPLFCVTFPPAYITKKMRSRMAK